MSRSLFHIVVKVSRVSITLREPLLAAELAPISLAKEKWFLSLEDKAINTLN